MSVIIVTLYIYYFEITEHTVIEIPLLPTNFDPQSLGAVSRLIDE